MGQELDNTSKNIAGVFKKFTEKYPVAKEFLIFLVISNGVTVLQMVLMPLLKYIFGFTSLINVNFKLLPVGSNLDGSKYYVFNYEKGSIITGGGGGLAYFLAVEITLFIAQIINFYLQRNVTFKSKTNIFNAAMWYFIAWVIISVGAAALQGLYKVPIYSLFMNRFGQSIGMTVADFITMLINCAISFWVFFPIMKIIFKEKKQV